MERGVATGSGKVWTGIVIALGVGVVGTVVGGLILLVIEYKSGYFNGPPPELRGYTPDRSKHVGEKAVPAVIPKDVPKLHLKPEIKATSPRPPEEQEAKAAKAKPDAVDLTFEHFARTYESLDEKDRAVYAQSLAGKRIGWTAYIKQLNLERNYLYVDAKRDGPYVVNVCVEFKEDMRLQIGPLNSKLYVCGDVEIRGRWVIIAASELKVVRN
jgi:hypothetical protein